MGVCRCLQFSAQVASKEALLSELLEENGRLRAIGDIGLMTAPSAPHASSPAAAAVARGDPAGTPVASVEAIGGAQDHHPQQQQALSSSPPLPSEDADRTANMWWSYVWHAVSATAASTADNFKQPTELLEMRLDENEAAAAASSAAAVSGRSVESERQHKLIASLRTAVSQQAVELATAKQVSLSARASECLARDAAATTALISFSLLCIYFIIVFLYCIYI